jgi:hypothetical protein
MVLKSKFMRQLYYKMSPCYNKHKSRSTTDYVTVYSSHHYWIDRSVDQTTDYVLIKISIIGTILLEDFSI